MEIVPINDQTEENGDATDQSLLETRQNVANTSFNESYHNSSPSMAGCRFNEGLIGAVAGYPCLYDADDPSYKEHPIKEQSWYAVSRQINCAVTECKRKWRNLRDVYCRNRKKVEATNQQTSNWYYYNILHSFLHDKVKVSVDPSYELLHDQSAECVEALTYPAVAARTNDVTPKHKPAKVKIQKRASTSIFKRACRPSKRRHVESRPVEARAAPPSQTTTSLLWAQSIGMRLDELSVYQQAQFRIKVETLLMEAEMQGHVFPVEAHEALTLEQVDEMTNGDCKASILKVQMQ